MTAADLQAETVTLERTTAETRIRCSLRLPSGTSREQRVEVATGIGFLDHMLTTLATHAGWSLTLRAEGDLAIDDHHTAEDCAIVLGQAIAAALGDRSGRARFGDAYAPLDESLARAVIDLVERPSATVEIPFVRPTIGGLATETIVHLLESLAIAGRFTMHIDLLRGRNDHHKAEAAFKALAVAFARATAPGPSRSTKRTLLATGEEALP